MVVWTDWSTVAQWADLPSGARGADYNAFKQQVEDKMFAQFKANFPDLAELVVFRELSTPLATAAITGHHQGRFYGLDGTPERVLSNALKAKTMPGPCSSVECWDGRRCKSYCDVAEFCDKGGQ